MHQDFQKALQVVLMCSQTGKYWLQARVKRCQLSAEESYSGQACIFQCDRKNTRRFMGLYIFFLDKWTITYSLLFQFNLLENMPKVNRCMINLANQVDPCSKCLLCVTKGKVLELCIPNYSLLFCARLKLLYHPTMECDPSQEENKNTSIAFIISNGIREGLRCLKTTCPFPNLFET